MTSIQLTGLPDGFAEKYIATWQRSVEETPRVDRRAFWVESLAQYEALADVYTELLDLGVGSMLGKIVIDARSSARADARQARQELARLDTSAGSRSL